MQRDSYFLLWETDKPAKGLNGIGPDNYEETLFSECFVSVINNYDPSTSLLLYYAPHIALH